ncbi:MAG: LiaF domain-containing protein [Nannocystales bacterium]
MTRFALPLLTLAVGCGHLAEPIGPDPVDAQFVFPRDGARSASVELLTNGDLAVRGGSCSLAQARARYDAKRAHADTQYALDENGQGIVEVELLGKAGRGGDMDLDICLSTELPMNLRATSTLGDIGMDLSGVQVRGLGSTVGIGDLDVDFGDASVAQASITVEAGTGDVSVDAKRSTWTGTNEISIASGTGDVTVYLPRGIGLQVEVEHGIGDIVVRGLEQDGDEYTNSLAASSENVLELEIEVGTGDVTVIAG